MTPPVAFEPLAFERVAVIGVGLIGGSFALGLRAQGSGATIVGCGRGRDNLDRALQLGVIDQATRDVATAVEKADLVFLSMPVGASRAIFQAMRGHLREDVLITDAGSTKASVMRDAEQVFGELPPRFVPGHPVAGTEHSGVDAAFASLFQQRRVILTPAATTDRTAVERVAALWRTLGSEVVQMSAEHHDEVLAATSHLPHLLAYSLVDTLARMAQRREVFEYAAGGFADFSRIASSSPRMWADIVAANRPALLPVLDDYIASLQALREDIQSTRMDAVHDLFARAKHTRDQFVETRGRQSRPAGGSNEC